MKRETNSAMTAKPFLSPEAFVFWLDLVRFKKLAKSDAEAGQLLGITKNTVSTMKKSGADQRTALACNAILHRLPPFHRDQFEEPPDTMWNE